MFANEHDPWYDCTGYMIVYGKSGNFAIVATDDGIINPNKSPIVKKNGISSREAVTFTVTNNGNSKETYSANCSNLADSGIEIISSPIELKAGETGELKVAFRGSKAVKNRVLTLVVEKDNGWKEEKLRAIEINVSNEEATFMENYGHLLPIMIGGAVFLLVAIVIIVIIVLKKHKKNR